MNVQQLRRMLEAGLKALEDVDDDVKIMGDYSQVGGYGAEPEPATRFSIDVDNDVPYDEDEDGNELTETVVTINLETT